MPLPLKAIVLNTVSAGAAWGVMTLVWQHGYGSRALFGIPAIKILATGLGAGSLLDATVVRPLLVPALVSLFGRWNRWMPALPARLLRIPAAAGLGEEPVA